MFSYVKWVSFNDQIGIYNIHGANKNKKNRELGAVFPGNKAVPGYHELSKRPMEQVSLIGIIETGKLATRQVMWVRVATWNNERGGVAHSSARS